MSFSNLRITGPDAARYELGKPMYVYDRHAHLGVLDPVHVSRDGTEVHISRFAATPFVKSARRNFGPLVLVEVTSFLAEQFEAVQSVSFSLSREIETYGDGTKVATARSVLLEEIGASGVTISPQPDSETPGNFVVQGMWTYNERNLAALQDRLRLEREIYCDLERHARQVTAVLGLRGRLRRWWTGHRRHGR
jgi:hypothetical protein